MSDERHIERKPGGATPGAKKAKAKVPEGTASELLAEIQKHVAASAALAKMAEDTSVPSPDLTSVARSASETTRLLAATAKQAFPTDSERALKSFQTLWVAGTVGALFAILTRTLPGAFQDLTWPPDADTIDTILRFGYVAWLLAYFFMSDVLNQRSSTQAPDVWFDIFQSIAALSTAWSFGFLATGFGYPIADHRGAMTVANLVVLAIALVSLGVYGPQTRAVDKYRIQGSVLAFLALLTWWAFPLSPLDHLIVNLILFLFLAGTLFLYLRHRLTA